MSWRGHHGAMMLLLRRWLLISAGLQQQQCKSPVMTMPKYASLGPKCCQQVECLACFWFSTHSPAACTVSLLCLCVLSSVYCSAVPCMLQAVISTCILLCCSLLWTNSGRVVLSWQLQTHVVHLFGGCWRSSRPLCHAQPCISACILCCCAITLGMHAVHCVVLQVLALSVMVRIGSRSAPSPSLTIPPSTCMSATWSYCHTPPVPTKTGQTGTSATGHAM